MTAPFPIQKACPVCGKPTKVVPKDQTRRYLCTSYDDDPLHDPAARKWRRDR